MPVRVFNPGDHEFFDELVGILIEFSSLSVAIQAFDTGGRTSIPIDRSHTLSLHGRRTTVTWPSFELVHLITSNGWPSQVSLEFTRKAPARGAANNVELNNSGVEKMAIQIIGSPFLKFYKRGVTRIRSKHSNNQRAWPAAWQLGWMLRNAIAHGDRFAISDQSFPAVTWAGITVGPADDGQPWFDISRYLAGGDVIALMDAMQVDLLAA